ncbi:MAG: RNA polymerase sigma factor, partial [Clostridia bacterium]|nr:RNA polymerase sigma factor [Clostridia bacterium]
MATVLEPLEIERLTSPAEFVAELPMPLPEAPESPICALVEAAKRGEEEAWERVVAMYGQVVYDTIRRRVKSDADADEVRQEVFLQALRKLPQLKEPQALGSWLRRIADRLAINYVTRRHGAS